MKWNRGILLLIVALIVGGVLIFYFTYFSNESEKPPIPQDTERVKSEAHETRPMEPNEAPVQSPTVSIPQEEVEEDIEKKEVENIPLKLEDQCQKMEQDLEAFFTYLDTKDYIKELKLGEDTFSRFLRITHDLALAPPLPAGEGFDYDMIIKNIYHFYRVMNKTDLNMIRLILENEADTMEVNLALFYKWLMSGEECGRKEGIPPTLDTLYRYAGFLVNSIGGRAYLFRRQTRLRLLLYYYSLLIIHEADKKKMNSFGVDIIPFLEPLAEEIENYELLYFRKEYAGKLVTLKNYYLDKRKTS
jgi:hypothetical protein